MTHVAFLRAINVGGRGVVKMPALKEAFEGAGCRNVRTFIASGNVVFDAAPRLPPSLKARVSTTVEKLLGTKPGICYRTVEEIEALIATNPFGTRAADKTLRLYVAFMNREPTPRPTLPIVDARELVEIIDIQAADMLIVSRRKPSGMYGFPNACVEALGVVATTRNWNTVLRVAQFARR